MKEILKLTHSLNGIESKSMIGHQRYFLRLYVHNYAYEDICNYIEIMPRDKRDLKKSIELLFGTKDWVNIVALGFEMKVLDYYDYVHDFIKEKALFFADQIMCQLNNVSHSTGEKLKKITKINREFYEKCHKGLDTYEENKSHYSLSDEEHYFLDCLYKGIDMDIISAVLKYSLPQLNYLKRRIMSKLKAENYFNLIRNALKYDLLDKKEKLLKPNIYNLSNKKALEMIIFHEKEALQSEKIIHQKVYRTLAKFHIEVEFTTLFGGYKLNGASLTKSSGA